MTAPPPAEAFDHVRHLRQVLEIVGERWMLLIVRDAVFGLKRFDESRQSLGIVGNDLTDRLASLVEQDILSSRTSS